jgi:hypothetical protein
VFKKRGKEEKKGTRKGHREEDKQNGTKHDHYQLQNVGQWCGANGAPTNWQSIRLTEQ